MKPNGNSLVPISDVIQRLVLPTTGQAISRKNFDRRLKALEISTVLQRRGDKGYLMAHITLDQAAAVEEDFKRDHRNKFKAAEAKGSK